MEAAVPGDPLNPARSGRPDPGTFARAEVRSPALSTGPGHVGSAPSRGVGALGVVVGLLALALFLPVADTLHPWGVGNPEHWAAARFPGGRVGPPATSYPTPIRHVFVVMLENEKRATVLANGPFERYLQSTYASAQSYYAICHPSAPNYLSITSGKAWQCGSDGYRTYPTENVGDLAEKAGLSWAGYEESMPTPCDTNDSYPYAVKHDPFVYYSDIVSNGSECRSHVVPFTNWTSALAVGSIPDLAIFTPNLTDDGHDTGAAFADRWLQGWLSPLVNDSFFANSVFFVTYDESVNDGSGYNGTAGGQVYFTAVSPYARSGYAFPGNASHYSLLSTIEWLLALGNCSHNDGTAAFPPLTSLFFGRAEGNTTHYSVSGTVTTSAGRTPVAGAAVALSGHPPVITNASGMFAFSVTNGTYQVGVTAAGFRPANRTVEVNGSSVVIGWALLPWGSNATYYLHGMVRSEATGDSLPNVTVAVLGGNSTLSGPGGNFSLSEPNGTYLLTASRGGYVAASANATVDGSAASVDFTLVPTPPPLYPFTGRVLSAMNGSPVVGADIRFDSGETGRTNASGGFRVNVVNGTYSIEVSAAGYVSANLTANVEGPSATEIIRLEATRSIPHPLEINVTASSLTPTVAVLVTFRVNSSGGISPYSATWRFGDGGTENGSVVTHTFGSTGEYPVLVQVEDAAGAIREAGLNLTVSNSSLGGGSGAPGGPVSTAPLLFLAMAIVLTAVIAAGGVTFLVGRFRRHRQRGLGR